MKVSVDLREKRDAKGVAYLFAPLPALNMVLFVFEDGVRDGVRRAQLVLKPYEPGRDYRDAWDDERGRQR